MYLDAQRDGDLLTVTPRGDWRIAKLPAIKAELSGVEVGNGGRIRLDGASASYDLSSAWLLHDFLQQARAHGAVVEYAGSIPESLQLIDTTLAHDADKAVPVPGHDEWLYAVAAVEGIGRRTVATVRRSWAALDFIGQLAAAMAAGLMRWKRLRPVSIARHVYDTGVTAIPIVALIGFLISVIMAYIGAQQLRKFGADIFVVDLVTIGVLRELGVLLTAIIVAGRSGSAFAAELGAMRLNEEIDALYATGVNPIEVLVVPRLIGLMIALPLLTVLADLVGLVGGGLLCHALLDMPLAQYVNRVQDSIGIHTFWVGIWKAPVFAVLIAVAGTRCGLRVRGSSRHLGAMTTLAVVQSIFFVILADALFAMVFMELDI
jgi:phospholipid/cholesterol/gamma-HCH transport system permease protein